MLKKILFLFFVGGALLNNAKAQNLVPNGDFEEYSFLPNDVGYFDPCLYWLNPNQASPDYYHTNATGAAQLPNTSFAYVTPYSGNAVVGFYLAHINTYREYIMAVLTSPMEIGKEYTLSFAVTNGFSDHFFGWSCDRLGIRFTTYDHYTNSTQTIPGIEPQLALQGDIWDTTWREVSFNYIPDSNYTYMIIGNFYYDWETTEVYHTLPQFPGYEGYAYYYFDKVELIEKVYPVTIEMPNVFTPNQDGINDTYQPIDMDGIEQFNLTIHNRWGELVFQTNDYTTTWDGKFNGNDCSDGVYYWSVNYTDINQKSDLLNGFLTLSR